MRLLLAALASVLLASNAHAIEIGYISQCFTSVLPGMLAFLVNDLDCPSYPGNDIPIIGLQEGSRLRLAGHTIQGGNVGVRSTGRRASIEGPGAIRGMVDAGVVTEGRMAIKNVDLDRNFYGIYSPKHSPLMLEAVSVTNSIEYGITMGPSAIGSGKIAGKDIVVTNSGRVGIEGQIVRLRNVTITGNRYSGVVGTRAVRIRDGEVTGNGADGFAMFERADIASFEARPRVPGVICDRSVNDVGTPWGVCSQD